MKLTPEQILDDFARDIKTLQSLSARREYMNARRKAVLKLTQLDADREWLDSTKLRKKIAQFLYSNDNVMTGDTYNTADQIIDLIKGEKCQK